MHSSIFVLLLGTIATASSLHITLDYSEAPDLRNFAYKVRNTLQDWFPYISSKLKSPDFVPTNNVSIYFDPKYEGAAKTYGFKNQIVGSVNYYRGHPDDIGSMVHELAHVLQKYKRCDGWITEGIADWIRYYHYEPSKMPQKPAENKHYTNGYGVAAYFLNYIDRTYTKYGSMIYWINKDCREGTYKPSIFTRLTGKDVDQLWNEMLTLG